MPIINNQIVCVNHQTIPMQRNEGFSAITSVTKQGENVSFNPANGVPVRLFYCRICGYIETYAAAVIDQDWARS
jgi:hypothetical protein